MTRFTKIGIIGAIYVALTLYLINSATANTNILLLSNGGGSIFTMYGLAVLGLSIVAGVIILVVARERE